MTFDIVVIGGGIAGMTAARRSQQLGVRVVVLDKAPAHADPLDPGSNTRKSGGLFHAAYRDPRRWSPDDLYQNLVRKTDGYSRDDVARAWAANVLRARDFLESEGIEIGRDGEIEMQWNALLPPMTAYYDLEWQGRGPDVLLTRMQRALEQGGGTYRRGTRAVELVMQDGRTIGVVAVSSDGSTDTLMCGAVIMADGGFQANAELVHRYITTDYVVNGTRLNTGDCLRMGLAVGAKAVNMDAFYGHIRVRNALAEPERLFRYPNPRWLVNAAMVVNARGVRIGDETIGVPEGVESIATSIARCDTPGGCWVVFDDLTWRTTAATGALPLNPKLLEINGPFASANSIGDLSTLIGVPRETLTRSADAFNRFCTEGVPLDPARSELASPIAVPPFHAIPIITGVTFTMGGLLVNGYAQVLDQSEAPIRGLYAAGGTMGGLQGGPRNGYSGGWSEATTFGLLAAEHASGYVKVMPAETGSGVATSPGG